MKFTSALILFTILQTLVYTIMLIYASRVPSKAHGNEVKNVRGFSKNKRLVFVIVLSELITIILMHVDEFMLRTACRIAILTLPTVLLMTYIPILSNRKLQMHNLQLFAFIMLSIIVSLPKLYPYRIYIVERHGELAKMLFQGFYDPKTSTLSPAYDPFPMDLGLFLAFVKITGLPPIFKVVRDIITYFMLISFAILMMCIVKRLIGQIAGLVAILICCFIPPFYSFLGHHGRFLGVIAILIALLTLIFLFKETKNFKSNIIVLSLSYAAGVLSHPVALAFVFVFALIIFFNNFTKHNFLSRLFKLYCIDRTFEKHRLYLLIFVIVLIISIVRIIYSKGFKSPFMETISGYIVSFFSRSGEGGILPKYERANVPFIQAYAWATPVSLATACALSILASRKRKFLVLLTNTLLLFSTYTAGILLLFTGAIDAIITHIPLSSFRASTYSGFILLIPSATYTVWRLLKSNRSLMKIVLIILLLISAIIAMKDPMLSPTGFGIGGEQILQQERHIMLVKITLELWSPNVAKIKAPYELIHIFSYLREQHETPNLLLGEFRGETDPKYNKDYLLLIKGIIEEDTYYIIRESMFPYNLRKSIDLTYTDGQYLGFIKSFNRISK